MLGDCYFLAALSAYTFKNPGTDLLPRYSTSKGFYLARFFIRGKPWYVPVDDLLMFEGSDLRFARYQPISNSLWVPIVEKAFVKARGTYYNADGGDTASALRMITGAPVDRYILNYMPMLELNRILLQAEEFGFIMTATTGNSPTHYVKPCGVRSGHAFSIMSTFEIIKANGEIITLIMIRNPREETNYVGKFNDGDSFDWTEDLVKQVPYGIDPRNCEKDGIFIVPIELFRKCFGNLHVAHYLKNEGYQTSYLDVNNIPDRKVQNITFTVPENETSSETALYFELESYFRGQISP